MAQATLVERISAQKKELERLEKLVVERAGKDLVIKPSYENVYKQIESPDLLARIAKTQSDVYSAPAEIRARNKGLYNPADQERLAASGTSAMEQKLAKLQSIKEKRQAKAGTLGDYATKKYQAETARLSAQGTIASSGYSRLKDEEQQKYQRGRYAASDLRAERADIRAEESHAIDLRDEGIDQPYSALGGDLNKAPIDIFMKAMAQQESGGNYEAKGAAGELGKYQIMQENWINWGSEYLESIEENPRKELFLSPENQEKVAKFKIEQYWDKYGNWADVAAAWNSGKPRLNDKGQYTNSKGVPNVDKYVKAVMGNLDRLMGEQQTEDDGGWEPTNNQIGSLEQKFGPNWKQDSSKTQQLDHLYGTDQIEKVVAATAAKRLSLGIPNEVAKGILLDLQGGDEPSEIKAALKEAGWPEDYFDKLMDLIAGNTLLGATVQGMKFIPRD